MTKNELKAIVKERIAQINTSLVKMDDETAVGFTTLFPAWVVGMLCTAGDRLQYDGKLYRVEQTHTSQAGWEPPMVPALFTEIAAPGVIPVWKQPTSALDAYNKGEKVHYPHEYDPIYRSKIDANVWPPDNPDLWEVVEE